ncbi:LacI family DNA-binding transcriptional regulator [Clostridium septicum]|uniref:LacI family transcriptional regulator n=1 Tax=Clostridium septicum TaxID=1504 RepID=A0A9N7JJ90_CLOSE|nr:LacI family DNA-binding transcriptional regulator [Clostridium septicum]AYE33628.1 LacI family transcriptional regulator [Clostridium septicum]MDU1312826.1 LacI family DNA-binding transcriptional regulator [Clostridium septicum]QAS61792.1 LacI family transcriptional regulator [Clostridium septicum]UEC21759.1 LacI family transcriptional regulator [Clostridium septicum]USS00188.1 LacI family transcriptional regulator [Clostridium septicum]
MKVTIKDVAREANVATSTVSRVLSNSSQISKETKDRVNAAIKKLNYTPNIIARGLANKKTNILAVVIPEKAEMIFANPFFIQAMKGVSICAEKENYYIMYAFKEEDKNDEEHIRRFIDSNLVDGICLFRAKDHDPYIDYLKDKKFPFVVIGRPEEANNVLWVDNDNFKAMYDLTNKLIDMGHEKIGFIGANMSLNVSKDRLKGYKQGLLSRGIEIEEKLICEVDEFKEECGYNAAKKMLKYTKPTAIVATDDIMAFGVQDLLRELDIEGISVIGFNNIPLADYRIPKLSSVDINSEKLGFYAAKLLIDNLNKSDNRTNYIIDTKLIMRESLKENNAIGCINKRK